MKPQDKKAFNRWFDKNIDANAIEIWEAAIKYANRKKKSSLKKSKKN